ncbi:tautomerase family protein [Salininema proteolyticum]|uniref:4-oxalocrotonate tautomerase family protein n=1 Tax=Salininema proteolyticum TaxID=1607685 RepID=A0ABV8TUY6_9ACTN
MPMITLTTTAGALTEKGRRTVKKDLVWSLMRWEGAPDTEFFRSQSWCHLVELPEDGQCTAEDDEPRFLVEATIPQGGMSERRKGGIAEEVTGIVLEAAGLDEEHAGRVWVLFDEKPDGTWAVGGHLFRFSELLTLAESERGETDGD